MVEKLDVIAKPASCVASGSTTARPGPRVARADAPLQVMFSRGQSGASASSASRRPTVSAELPDRPKLTTSRRPPRKKARGRATMSVVGTDRRRRGPVPSSPAARMSPM